MNKKKALGDWNQDYYNNVLTIGENSRAGECIGCGGCERACPQKLPIRKLLKEVSARFDKGYH